MLEKNFPGFKYNPNGAPLLTQISASLQGKPVPVSVGVSGTVLGYGKSATVSTEESGVGTSYNPLTIVGGSIDISIGKGVETSIGTSKHSSVGVLWRKKDDGTVAIGGAAIHIGSGKGSPINISVPLEE